MNKLKAFVKTTFVGGFTVVLPVAVLLVVFSWVFKFATGLISPLTAFLVDNFHIDKTGADLVALFFILVFCFIVGFFVRTRTGRFLYAYFEKNLLQTTPGYNLIKETISQFSGGKAPFSKVALVKPFADSALMTAFITHEHTDGSYTVFVPVSPPTSGFVFHLKRDCVHPVNISVEEAMKTVIGCGVGSSKLMEGYIGRQKK